VAAAAEMGYIEVELVVFLVAIYNTCGLVGFLHAKAANV
jgi:AhpD family alkylhydroperoxidase